MGIALALVVAYGVYLALVPRTPQSGILRVPAIDSAGLDPAVAKLIQTTLEEAKQAPSSGVAWGKIGSVLMHYEFIDAARSAFERAERLSPQEARWPYLHALLVMNSAPDEALAKLRRAVELARDQPDMPRLRLAQFLLERGRDKEAESQFRALLQRKPNHSPARLGLARLSFQHEKLAESSNLLSQCLDDMHSAKSAYAQLAVVERGLGNVAGAEAAARRSAALPPDQPWPDPFWDEAVRYRVGRKALIEDATTLLDHGRVADALQSLTVLTRDYPDDDEGWYLMGWAYNQQQQPIEAERALREHLRRSPRSPKGHSQLAVALLNQKRFAEAKEVLEAALQLKSTWRELHYNLGYACAQLGETNQAVSHLREALARDPNYVPSYIALGQLLIRRGEKNEAKQLLLQALDLSPSDARARTLLKQIEQP